MFLGEIHELNLTPEQHRRIRGLLVEARRKRQSSASKPLDLTVIANPGSPDFRRAVESAKARAAERIEGESDLATQIYGVLTPPQKRDLGTLLAAAEVRAEQMRKRMQERRAERQQQSGRPGASPGAPAN